MFSTFFARTAIVADAGDAAPESVSFRARIDSWRFERDVAAILSALDRLSDRRLHMIGMRRESLFEAVSDLMMQAEEQRAIGAEVAALLEKPGAGAVQGDVAQADAKRTPDAPSGMAKAA